MEDRRVDSEALFDKFVEEKRRIQGLESGFDPMRLAPITTVSAVAVSSQYLSQTNRMVNTTAQFPLAKALRNHIKDSMVQDVSSLVKCRLLSDLKWKVGLARSTPWPSANSHRHGSR